MEVTQSPNIYGPSAKMFQTMLDNIALALEDQLQRGTLNPLTLRQNIQNRLDPYVYPKEYVLLNPPKVSYQTQQQQLSEHVGFYFKYLKDDYAIFNNSTYDKDKYFISQLEKIRVNYSERLRQAIDNAVEDLPKIPSTSCFRSFLLPSKPERVSSAFHRNSQDVNIEQADEFSKRLLQLIESSYSQTKHQPRNSDYSYSNSYQNPSASSLDHLSINHRNKQDVSGLLKSLFGSKKQKSPNPSIATGNLLQSEQGVLKLKQNFHKYMGFQRFYGLVHLIEMLKANPYLLDLVPQFPYKDQLSYILTLHMEMILPKHVENDFVQLRTTVYQELQTMLKELRSSKNGPNDAYHEHQCWQVLLIFVFKGFTRSEYCPYRRRILKSIFYRFDKVKNPSQMLRVMENLVFNSVPHSLPVFKRQDKDKFKKFVDTKLKEINEGFKSKKIPCSQNIVFKLPQFSLTKVTDITSRRKVVTVLVSGFLSESNDKASEWSGMVESMQDSEVYALEWKSSTLGRLIKFVGQSSVQVFGSHGKGGLTGKLSAMSDKFNGKLNDNPYISAFAIAQQVGPYLAQLIIELFPGQFVNLLAYSLGTQLIVATLKQIHLRNMDRMVNRVCLMGGVTDHQQLNKVAKSLKYPIELVNYHCSNDTVLKHVLSVCMPKVKPIGIFQIPNHQCQGHKLTNFDCTKYVSGHLAYMMNWKVISRLLSMNQQ